MQYLLILYFGLNVTTPSDALVTGPLDPATCAEMAHIGSDAKHRTSCVSMPAANVQLKNHACAFVDADGDAVIITSYTCEE